MGDRRPRQAGQSQWQEQHGHVDGGSPEEQLDPDQEGAGHHGQAAEEDDEGRRGRLTRRAAGERGGHRAHEVTGVQSRPVGHGGREVVGDAQSELDELDGHGGEQKGERHVDDDRPHEHGEVLPVDRLDDPKEQQRHDDHAAEGGHRLVVLAEPRGTEVDRRRRGQHRADLVE